MKERTETMHNSVPLYYKVNRFTWIRSVKESLKITPAQANLLKSHPPECTRFLSRVHCRAVEITHVQDATVSTPWTSWSFANVEGQCYRSDPNTDTKKTKCIRGSAVKKILGCLVTMVMRFLQELWCKRKWNIGPSSRSQSLKQELIQHKCHGWLDSQKAFCGTVAADFCDWAPLLLLGSDLYQIQ